MATDPWAQFKDAPPPEQRVAGNTSEPDPWAQFQDAPSSPAQPAAPGIRAPDWLRTANDIGGRLLLNTQGALSEPAMQMVSGAVAAPVSGIAGIATAAGNALGFTDAQPADVIERVGSAMTYQPRTTAGKAVSSVVQYPFEKITQFADWAGGGVAEATASPAAGAALNTAIQSAPALLLRGRGRAPRETPRRVEPTIEPLPGETAPRVQPATPAEPANVTAARDYVARNTALDWNALSDAVRARLADIARDSDTLGKLDPTALERQSRLESLPVPIRATRGQLTRDTAQLNNEGTLAATEAGRELKAIRDAQSPAIVANLEVLKGRTRGAAQSPEQVGLSVQDAALRAKLRLSQENVQRLYREAETAGELQGTASTRSLARMLEETPDLQHLGWVESWLNKANVVTDQKGAATKGMRMRASLKELEDLRQAAVARAMDGGTDGYYAGKVIRAIDEATDGAGGNAYKAARAARRRQALEFEEQGAVARLVENKSRTDRATALENTWQSVVRSGSIEDLNKVKRSLLTGGDAKTRAAGRQAWRDIRAQTIQNIIDESTKISAPLPDGSPVVSAAGMQKAVNGIGQAKLDAIFGPGTSSMINRILQATKDLRTEPPRIHPGSSTLGNVVAFLERNLSRVPVLGDTAAGAIRAGVKLRDMGRAGREVREAQQRPLDARPRDTRPPEVKNALAERNRKAGRNAFAASSTTQGQQ